MSSKLPKIEKLGAWFEYHNKGEGYLMLRGADFKNVEAAFIRRQRSQPWQQIDPKDLKSMLKATEGQK